MSVSAQQFHDERLREIEGLTGNPVPLEDGPYAVLHLIPDDFESTKVTSPVDLPDFPTHPKMIGGVNIYTTPEGRVVRKTRSDDMRPFAYGYLDCKGWFEGVYGGYSSDQFPSESFENHYRWWGVEAIDTLESIAVDLPVTVYITLLGYEGSEIAYLDSIGPLDSEPVIPSSQVDGVTQLNTLSITNSSLDSIFDEIWTQCGFPNGSPY